MTRRFSTHRTGARYRVADAKAIMPLIVLRFGLVGCQRPAHYPTREALDAGFGSATISLGSVDNCPAVSFTVSPAEARIGQSISVTAFATDVDSDAGDAITYAWTASSGYFQDASA